jgi:hypothetical protein
MNYNIYNKLKRIEKSIDKMVKKELEYNTIVTIIQIKLKTLLEDKQW